MNFHAEICRTTNGWVLQTKQQFTQSRSELFKFFSDVQNLQEITPPWLHFQILTPASLEIKQGTRIDYQLRLHGLPIRWKTEISVWEPPFRFVDRQLHGPYRKWIHEHRFVEQENGTLMIDRVDYDVPGGRWAHALFIQRDLKRIFDYRYGILHDRFATAR